MIRFKIKTDEISYMNWINFTEHYYDKVGHRSKIIRERDSDRIHK